MKYLFFVTVVILIIYFPWFNFSKTLSSGDWPYLFTENIQAFRIPAEPPFLWLDPYYQITAKIGVQLLSLPWDVTEKIFWFFPFIAISLISSYLFLKYLSKQLKIDGVKSSIFISLGCLIYATNTYILMVVGGGQMGVAMAYSVIPFVLRKFFSVINGDSPLRLREIALLSLILGSQFMFDPRISILTMIIIFLYLLFIALTKRKFELKAIKIFLIFIIAVMINFFWMYQNIGYFNQEYANATGNAGADFLSFATFSNSISLLHPNWPENIFGKIGFMKPEFIFIPVLAFISLIFTQKNRGIIFFAFLGLFGVFFAKGTNPPFGDLYTFLSSLPGFGIFRDPTKFYILIVISYMVLIPFSILQINSWLISKIKYHKLNISYIFLIFTILYLLFLIRPVVLGQLTGTFKPHVVPKEYVNLKDFLNTQPEFSKTLWVPQVERFGFTSKTLPAVSAMELFRVSSSSGVLDELDNPEIKKHLIKEEIKYVIVPYDYLGEIFITDRKYDEKLYIMSLDKLKKVGWLSEVKKDFGKIKVFEIN